MLTRLPPRERQLVELMYRQGPMTVAELCEALPGALSGSAVRAMLSRLEKKGAVERQKGGAAVRYRPKRAEAEEAQSLLGEIVRTFFNDSPASAASALLGMSEKLNGDHLDELEEMIRQARREGDAT